MCSRAGLRAVFLVFAVVVMAVRANAAETHRTGEDIRLTLDGGGRGTVEHLMAYRVAIGPLKWIDLSLASAALEGATFELSGPEGRPLRVRATSPGDTPRRPVSGSLPVEGPPESGAVPANPPAAAVSTVRLMVEEPAGAPRGIYQLRVRYPYDAASSGAFARSGAMWNLRWAAPPSPEGLDNVRWTLDVPATPSEPRALTDRGELLDMPALVQVHRTPERDVLQIARPHVTRGEAVVWGARLDPKAFPGVDRPELRPPPPPPAPPSARLWLAIQAAAAAIACVGLAAILHGKQRAVARACARAGVSARALVPGSDAWRCAMTTLLFTGGVAWQVAGRSVAGAMLIAFGMLGCVYLTPLGAHSIRGPGQWLALRADDPLFAPPAVSDPFDPAGLRGRRAAWVLGLGVAACAAFVARFNLRAASLTLVDALAFVPLFATGISAQLPPDRARAPVPFLRRVLARLDGVDWARATPWARLPTGVAEPDEIRLRVVARQVIAGFVACEVGVEWWRGQGGYTACPEVLVRVGEGSSAASRLSAYFPKRKLWPGQRPDERVFTFAPRLPTPSGVCGLIERLGEILAERRGVVPAVRPRPLRGYDGPDRRESRPKTPRNVPRAAA